MTESVDRQTAVLRLRGADDILILCHKNPDGDTIGCAGALYLALKALGKNAAILCSDPIPKMYDYMELRWFDGSFNPAFVVAVDVASIQLFGENNNVPQYAAHTNLCIDHHASNSGYAYETLLDPGAAAACEFLLDVIVDMGVTITPQIANCLYTGIATDTGCFKFASTTPRTHMAAARVMEAGADVEKLNARLFESRSHARMALRSAWRWKAWNSITTPVRLDLPDLGPDPSRRRGGCGTGRPDQPATLHRRRGSGPDPAPAEGWQLQDQRAHRSRHQRLQHCAASGRRGHPRAAGCEISGNLDNAKHAILDPQK